ncbi:hypothetical protein P7H25_22475 [Paenibacillus larvae]|nr:hypothetical protein [Paenibacillus larvae]MDT2257755.1 hypothetical protein [Paenibacillus larvae]
MTRKKLTGSAAAMLVLIIATILLVPGMFHATAQEQPCRHLPYNRRKPSRKRSMPNASLEPPGSLRHGILIGLPVRDCLRTAETRIYSNSG